MIETIFFLGIGFFAIYFLYKITFKQIKEGKCSSCPSSKSCKSKECK